MSLGAKFVKVNKRRIRKRALEGFLKEKTFDSEILTFERSRHLLNTFELQSNRFSRLTPGEESSLEDEDISRILERSDDEMTARIGTCRLHFPVDRALFSKLGQSVFAENDGVLYPLKETCDRHFYQSAEALIKSHRNRVTKAKTPTPQTNSIDAQIKAELKKLKKMLRAQKAHENFGFSRIQKMFGWVRFSDEPSWFYRFEVSGHHFEIDQSSRRQVKVVPSEMGLRTKSEFEKHPQLEAEEALGKFLETLPEKSAVHRLSLSQSEQSYLKCFILGTNANIKNQKSVFSFLDRSQKSEKFANCASSLQNQKSPQATAAVKNQIDSITLNTKSVNPLLLRQFLVKPVAVPQFVALDELDEDKIRELQIQYQDWGLENGDFFDGFLFRNEYGDPYREHPSRSTGNLTTRQTGRAARPPPENQRFDRSDPALVVE